METQDSTQSSIYDALVLFLLVLWAFVSYQNWITDSEFWPVTLSGHFSLWHQHPALIYKSLFHASLSWIYLFDLNSADHIRMAKFFYSFLGILYFYYFYCIAKRYLDQLNSFLLLLVLLFSAFGFTQIGNIRSDFLAALIAIIYFDLKGRKPQLANQFWFFLSISIGLILVTPKSIYLVIVLWFYHILNLPGEKRLRFFNWSVFLVILSLLSLMTLDQYYLKQKIMASLLSAWQHFQSDSSKLIDYDVQTFLFPFLKKDFPLIIFIGLSIITALFQLRRFYKVLIPAVLLIIFLIFHRPILPFFVGPLIGLFLILMMPILKLKAAKLKWSLVFILTSYIFIQKSNFYYQSSLPQLHAIHVFENYLKENSFSVIDGIGLFPRYNKLKFIYLGPHDASASELQYDLIESLKVDTIVYSPRFLNIEPQVSQFLLANYKVIGKGYWLRNDLEIEERFDNILPAFQFGYQPEIRINKN